jgi:hypothetical protein
LKRGPEGFGYDTALSARSINSLVHVPDEKLTAAEVTDAD